MSDWPARTETWGGVDQWVISPMSTVSVGTALRPFNASAAPTSQAWPATDRAILIPFRLATTATAYQIVAGCGTTAGGNFDVGIYDRYGTRLVSSGSTGRSASGEVICNITDTVLGPGVYYMAMSVDGTDNMIARAPTANLCKIMGIRQASAAFVLPDPVTFETAAAAYVPHFGVWFRST